MIERDGASFKPVEPMGKAAVLRLRKAMRAAVKKGLKLDLGDGSPAASLPNAENSCSTADQAMLCRLLAVNRASGTGTGQGSWRTSSACSGNRLVPA